MPLSHLRRRSRDRPCLKGILLQERVSNRFDGLKFELLVEISPDGVGIDYQTFS